MEDYDEFKATSIEHEAEIMLVEFGSEWALGYAVEALETAKKASDEAKVTYWLKVMRVMVDSLIAYRESGGDSAKGKLS